MLKSLLSELPENYDMDYLVYSLSGSLEEEEKLWDADYAKIIKRMLFKQFDSYVERKYYERTHNNG